MNATLLDELERLNQVRVAEREVGLALLALRLEDGDDAAHEAAVARLRERRLRFRSDPLPKDSRLRGIEKLRVST